MPTVGDVAVRETVGVDVEDLVLHVTEEAVPERVEEVQRLRIAAWKKRQQFLKKGS